MKTTQYWDDIPLSFPTLTHALLHWAATTPDALALTCGLDELTYADLADRVLRCVSWLHRQGLGCGDPVVIVGDNELDWVVHYLGVLSLGGIVAPANNRLNPCQFADQAELLDARLVLADAAHRHLVEAMDPATVRELADLYADCPPDRAVAADPKAPGLVSFTSGTTGRPKGAVLTQGALAQASWAFVPVLGTQRSDSTLVVVPLFHNTGIVDQLGQMLLLGARTDLLRKFRTADAVAALTARPVTYLAAVPSIHRMLMLAEGANTALDSVRVLLYGGSPMPAAWIAELRTTWPAMQLFHGYGMTEYGSAVSFLPPEYAAERGESIGFPVPGTSVRITDERGVDVAAGEVGELRVQGPTMMRGYWRQPELTDTKIDSGWLRTGDLARSDHGFLYIEGRVDDVINRGGEKVLPGHVESLLAELDTVAVGCVFAIPDPVLQNRVWAAVEERAGRSFDEDEARQALRAALPDYAVPERISVLSPLPRTGSGKVDRRAVAEHFAGPVSQTPMTSPT